MRTPRELVRLTGENISDIVRVHMVLILYSVARWHDVKRFFKVVDLKIYETCVISGSVEAAENYIQSFSKAADVQMHDLFKEEAGASFKEELKTYIKLVLFSLTLFQ